ncbi:MAG: cadherin-like beta sandwich domain-containing protein [Lachnospiraceae bacterium]|nr:cadherin-like beta sandwich domain-containing protein [Lachnospiraceae bacterium]
MGKVKQCGLWLAFAVAAVFVLTGRAEAAGSSAIRFTTASTQVKKGESFTVVCQVTSSTAFLDTEFNVEYDPEILQFVRGGSKVIGTGGILKVSSTGNSTATNKKTFSLEFVALKKGGSGIFASVGAKVTDESGAALSVSSNRLSINVVKKVTKPVVGADATALPKVTPAPVLNGNNKLKSLKTTALSMSPDFTPDITEYEMSVDCDTDTLYFTFETENAKSRVQIKGNEGLQTGDNIVELLVTAENGKKRSYKLNVTRETQTETESRESKKKPGKKDITFNIKKVNDRIILKNSYELEVQDVSELSEIPAGYIQSTIELNGISVPAFTIENDLDNNYLLLYLKGPGGESSLYQYDRAEQTLQRYTGNMIEKVNKSAGAEKETTNTPISNYILLGVIVGLVIIILCMLIAMLKMAMRRREEKAVAADSGTKRKNILDDLDF